MDDVLLGLAAIAVGLLFCFFGATALRIVISIWGAFVGFTVGAGLVAAIWDQGFLSEATGWFVGFVLAVVFAALAYLYYAVAILLATASLGFAIGAATMGALGVTWNWLVALVGVAVGVLLGIGAIVANLPRVLLVVLSSLGGASAAVTGVMLLTGAIDSADFDEVGITAQVSHDWWWYALYLAIAVVAMLSQFRAQARWDRGQWESTPA